MAKGLMMRGLCFVLVFLGFLTLTGCLLNTSALTPSCPTIDSEFQGCYQSDTDPRGWINIEQPTCNELTGMGRGLFDVGGGNDSNTVLLIHGNTGIVDEALGSTPPKMITTSGNAMVQGGVSRFGDGSISFDGSGDYLSIPDHTDFNFSDGTWTVDMWARVNVLNTTYILYYQRTDFTNLLQIFITSGNEIRLQIFSGGISVVDLLTPPVISSLTTWYHIEIVENRNDYYIFVNGLHMASTSSTSRPANYNGSVYIGANADGNASLNGYLDEIRVSKIARHTVGFLPPTSEWPEWQNVGWSFTGMVTAVGEATLNITREGGAIVTVNARRDTSVTPERLTLDIAGTSYVLRRGSECSP